MDDTRNFLEETLQVLVNHDKAPTDVEWCGFNRPELSTVDFETELFGWCTWEEFAAFAGCVKYDAGFGGAEIPLGLLVVGKDFWLERGEYDGGEWWEFKSLPVRPDCWVVFPVKVLKNSQKLIPG